MEQQLLSTVLAWGIALALLVIAGAILRNRRDIHWTVVAVYNVGTIALALAAAVTATSVLLSGSTLEAPARWFIIIARAVAAVLFLAVAMEATDRPRWVCRILARWFD